jgi:hypothetical protein
MLASAGITMAGGIQGAGFGTLAETSDWSEVDSPTEKTLYEVVTTVNGAYAVGESGNLIHRAASGWEVTISDGPTGNNKTLLAAGVTDDGERLWMCGKSGVLGEYDVSSDTLTDWSSPGGISDVFYDVEVTGPVNDEQIHLAMGSGKTLYGKRTDNGKFEWETKDTGGSYRINAIDFHTQSTGYAVSEGGGVYETQSKDSGSGWQWVRIGIDDAVNPLYDVVSGTENVYVGGDNGQIWRGDNGCRLWTPHSAGSNGVQALVRRNGEFLGAGGSGRVFGREGVFNEWVFHETPVGMDLLGCLIGDPDILVGKGGTILER